MPQKNGEMKKACKRAFVTFLAGDKDYVKGVIAVAKGLRKAKSRYPLLVAVLADVPPEHRELLTAQGCVVKEIEPVYPPQTHPANFARDYYVICYSKLRIWQFTEYSKLIYLDGDIQVLGNIDHLFDLPNGYFYGVPSCYCERHWIGFPQYEVGYCQVRPDKAHWPDELGQKPPLYVNAGMFVYEPDIFTYHDLLRRLEDSPRTAFAEQDFLNMYFKDKIRPISYVYNLLIQMLWNHPEDVELEKVKVVHYCINGSKPWRYTGKEENMERENVKILVNKWWDIYNDECLNLQLSGDNSQGKSPELVEALTNVSYFPAPSAA